MRIDHGSAGAPARHEERLDERLDVDVLRYSRVWEDEALLVGALTPGPDDDALSIASAGDNCLALLATDVRSVTAVDISPAQLALVDLHRAALDLLDHADHEVLVGLAPEAGTGRSALLARVAPQLEAPSRTWFDRHAEAVEAGLVGAGRLDRYFATFQEAAPELLGEDLLGEVLQLTAADLASGRAEDAVRRVMATAPFVSWFTDWFGRASMERNGRDPEQFRHVDGEVGDVFLRRLADHLRSVPSADNPYTWRFFTGGDGPGAATLALRDPERRGVLRARLDRLRLLRSDLGEAVDRARAGTWSVANLSDLFEYLSADESDRVFGLLAERLRPGARCAWWNLVVPRTVPERLDGLLGPAPSPAPDDERELVSPPAERTWFYGAFHTAVRSGGAADTGPRR